MTGTVSGVVVVVVVVTERVGAGGGGAETTCDSGWVTQPARRPRVLQQAMAAVNCRTAWTGFERDMSVISFVFMVR
jgi:hypothetical protein